MESWILGVCSLVCNQAPERTVTLGGGLLPLCARCSGIYAGVLLGTAYQLILLRFRIKKLPPLKVSLAALFFLGLLIADSLGSRFGLWDFPNRVRLNLGLLGGASISLFLFPVFNYLFFADSKNDNCMINGREYAGLLILLMLAGFAAASGRAVFYHPAALVSVSGIILLFLMLNMTIAAGITGFKRTKTPAKIFCLAGIILVLTAFELYLLRNVK